MSEGSSPGDRPPDDDSVDDEGADVLAFPGAGDAPFQLDFDESATADHPSMTPDAPAPDASQVDAEGVGDGAEETPADGDGPPVDPPQEPFEAFTEEQYVQSTTREYIGLAEAIQEAAEQEHEQQAVAAPMPGVSTGVVGFEDMTGEEEIDAEYLHQVERAERSDLAARIGTAVALVAVFFGAMLAGGAWIATFLGLVVLLSLGEFYASVRSAGFRPVVLFALLGAVGMLFGTWFAGPFAIGGFLAATMVLVMLWFSLVPRRNPLGNASITILGIAWIAALLAFAFPIFQAGDALPLVAAIVLITALFDIGSYFAGRAFGRTKLAPIISPNKTVEGLIGGVILALGTGAVFGRFDIFSDPLDMQMGLVLAAAICVVAPLGDLTESAIKRLIGVKDMGSILPGHGGMLDRVDGFIFSVPAAYFVYRWFELL